MSRDEEATLAFMDRAFATFEVKCNEFRGKLVKYTGDGIMAEFASASEAVTAAMAMQETFAQQCTQAADKRQFRIGIHLGEVEEKGADVYGHAVNIAARLEAEAEPGGVCVSHEVYMQARRGTPFSFVAGGATALKGIPEAIIIYHVAAASDGEDVARPDEGLLIEIMDGFSVVTGGGEAPIVRSDRVRALLGYLALCPRFSESQDRIAALLWPEHDLKVARRTLARCLRAASKLLSELAPDILVRHNDKISFDLARVEVDLVRVLGDLTRGTVDDVLIERPDWPDSILRGLGDVSKLFRSWLEVSRHNWRTRMAEALEACLQRFGAAELNARRAATALLVLEPSHEYAIQKLVEHHVAGGNVALAKKVFHEFQSTLREKYQITASAETVAFVERVTTTGGERARVAPEARRSAHRPRIVLGEFLAGGVGETPVHLVEGFRSQLLANLSRFRDWVVIEGGADTDRGSGPTADYKVTASCAKSHSGLSIVVTLSEPATGRVVWSDTFETSMENWFDVQHNVVRRVAACFEVYLSADRVASIIAAEDMNATDYDDWLRGEHLLSLWNPRSEDEAATIFERIITRSPHFAPAHASLAGIYNVRHLIRPGTSRDADSEGRALPLGHRAVELDALDSRNHQVIAWSCAMAGRHQQAAVHYELAISLNPSSPKSLISCAQGLAFAGLSQRAAELLEEAFHLAPFLLDYQWCYVGSTRYMIGDYEGAVAACLNGANLTLDTSGWRAAALARLGRTDEARDAFAEQVRLVQGVWAGDTEPTSDAVSGWFLSAFPIGRAEDREALAAALAAAVSA